MMKPKISPSRVWPVAVVIVAIVCLLITAPPPITALSWWLISIFLPGMAILALVSRQYDAVSWLESYVLGGAIGYSLNTLVLLLLVFVPGLYRSDLLLVAFGGGALLLSAWAALRRPDTVKSWLPRLQLVQDDWDRFALVVLAATLLFHLVGLGYSEYQGDELDVVETSLPVQWGEPTALFQHRKGPTEILLAASFARMEGSYTEGVIRLPYALAGLLAAGGGYVLFRRWFGRRVALIAIALYVLDGLTLGFTRIAQYHGVLLLGQIASLICFARFSDAKTRRSAFNWFVLGSFTLGFSLLTHYEAIFMGIIVLPLIWKGRRNLTGWWALGWMVAILLVAATLAYYIPFTTSSEFSATAERYTVTRIGLSGGPYNHLMHCGQAMLIYTSLYFTLVLILMSLVGLWVAVRAALKRTMLVAMVFIAFCLGLLALSVGCDNTVAPVITAGWIALLLPLISIIIFHPRVEYSYRVLAIWTFSYFLTYSFLFADPGLHFYQMMAPWVAWAALGITLLMRKLDSYIGSKWQAALVLLWLLMAAYPTMTFLAVEREALLRFSDDLLLRWWTPLSSRPEDIPLFGAPHRAGWAAVSALYQEGILVGDYISNSGNEIPRWYIGPRTSGRAMPTYALVVDQPFDRDHQESMFSLLATGRYQQIGRIVSDRRETIKIYKLDAPDEQMIREWNLQELVSRYRASFVLDEELAIRRQSLYWKGAGRFIDVFAAPGDSIAVCPPAVLPWMSVWIHSSLSLENRCDSSGWQVWDADHASLVDRQNHWSFGPVKIGQPAGAIIPGLQPVDFQEGLKLLGSRVAADLEMRELKVHLVWTRNTPPTVAQDYTAFVHLIDQQGNLVAQLDRQPEGGDRPVWQWKIGEVVDDEYVLSLPPTLPDGTYSIITGFYYWETGEHLATLSPAGEPTDTFWWLGDIKVQQGKAEVSYRG